MSSVPLELETTSFSLLDEASETLLDELLAGISLFSLEEDFGAMLEERPHSTEELVGSAGLSESAELLGKTVSLEFNAWAMLEEDSQPSQTDNKESSSRGATLM